MQRRFLLLSALTFACMFASLLGGVPTAQADVAPFPGYVERCTIARQQGPNEQCSLCRTYWRQPNRCSATFASQGFTRRCRTRGGSVWSEVWCRAKNTVHPHPTVSKKLTSPPQASPFIVVLTALLTSNVRLFTKSFSKKILSHPSSKNMKSNLAEGQKKFKKRFGNYRLEDFTFSYKGGPKEGRLYVIFKGKNVFPRGMSVIFEDGSWKLNEH
ncbi:MAG: hypothetical protein H6727_04860 [Myxococcales bacterium]|nr:hypothetical protein [Myxococcales bacterium]